MTLEKVRPEGVYKKLQLIRPPEIFSPVEMKPKLSEHLIDAEYILLC